MVRLLQKVTCELGPAGRGSAVWSSRVKGKGTLWSRLLPLLQLGRARALVQSPWRETRQEAGKKQWQHPERPRMGWLRFYLLDTESKGDFKEERCLYQLPVSDYGVRSEVTLGQAGTE